MFFPEDSHVKTYQVLEAEAESEVADLVCGGEMFRVIQQANPRFVVIENSPNLLKKGFEKVLYPLSEEGYNVEWQCLYASDLGKPHGRERVFIVAYSNQVRPLEAGFFKEINRNKHIKRASIAAHGVVDFNGCAYPKIPEDILLDDGIPIAMDFVGAFGNAIVPQVAYEIFKAIEKLTNLYEQE